ncbi:TIGR03826 family flagellar region protein [Ureibacillus acetophenoni]|uniref:Flagellar operon protein (TIGR03826 family) n=1 Tax=Ureibacillus acetophenoni TaxID=614649 RepID=A0A285TZN7_9BACL|nr:TIGR03826 family flagellar region protein [Ureibacillus acetophenoni]SOC34953.1 flagellar operon protein (TIGR03826 family) [Ureibacillus acetophenoni]
MAEIRNCPSCGEFFNYTGIRDICHKCAQNEEDMYQIVYRFLRKRENRAATVERIVEATGVQEELLYKWVRKGRLHPAVFPNLGYPCDNCGRLTNKGKLCQNCTDDLKSDLRTFEAAKEFREDIKRREKATYLADRKDN